MLAVRSLIAVAALGGAALSPLSGLGPAEAVHGRVAAVRGQTLNVQLEAGVVVRPGTRGAVTTRDGRTLAFVRVRELAGAVARCRTVSARGRIPLGLAVQFDRVDRAAQVVVRSTVPGARVYAVSGRARYAGPAPYSARLSPGTYEFEVRAEGHLPQRVRLDTGRNPDITVPLRRDPAADRATPDPARPPEPARPATVLIGADIEGAVVGYQTGQGGFRALGPAPYSAELRAGDYTYVVEREGYARARVNVVLSPGERFERTVAMRRLDIAAGRVEEPPATAPQETAATPPRELVLRVQVEPEALADSSLVTINGVARAPGADGRFRLPPGAYIVGVEAEGYFAPPQDIALDPSHRDGRTALFALVPSQGTSLNLSASRTNTSVFIDGEYVGIAGGSVALQVPVEPGPREIRFEAAGFEPQDVTIDAEPGQTSAVEALMVARTATLRVGAPAGAAVLLDGIEVGRGPVVLRVAAGTYSLAVRVRGRDVLREAALELGSGRTVSRAAGGVEPPPDVPGDAPFRSGASQIDPLTTGAISTGPPTAEAPLDPASELPPPPPGDRPGPLPPTQEGPPERLPSLPETAPEPLPARREAPLSFDASGAQARADSAAIALAEANRLADELAEQVAREEAAVVADRAQDPSRTRAQIERALLGGRYDEARRTVVLRISAGADAGATRQLQQIDAAIAVIETLSDQERDDLQILRADLRRLGARRDWPQVLEIAAAVFRLVPSDPGTLLYLRRRLSQAVTLPSGGSHETAFVPGAAQRSPETPPATAASRAAPADGFRLSVHEVTNAEFAAFLTETGTDRRRVVGRPVGLEQTGRTWEPRPGADLLPVVDATWEGAVAFAEWAGGRLPTAAEWQWARALGRAPEPSPAPALTFVNAAEPDALGLRFLDGNAAEWLAAPSSGSTRSAAGASFDDADARLTPQRLRMVRANRPDGRVGFRIAFDADNP